MPGMDSALPLSQPRLRARVLARDRGRPLGHRLDHRQRTLLHLAVGCGRGRWTWGHTASLFVTSPVLIAPHVQIPESVATASNLLWH